MNKRLKNALQTSFEAPQPADKERFLKTLHYPKIAYRDFLYGQFRYIRKRVWVLSAAFILIGWAIAFWPPLPIIWHSEAGAVWAVSAILPFMALLTAAEIYRSASYRMGELETSCRFNLSQIIMARISILGGGNLSVLTLLLVSINHVSPYGVSRLITYLSLPYLMTCGLCLLILNRMNRQESIFGCAACACIVCMMNTVLSNTVQLLYSNAYRHYWLILSAAAIVLIGIQMCRLLQQTEEKTWNLPLTE